MVYGCHWRQYLGAEQGDLRLVRMMPWHCTGYLRALEPQQWPQHLPSLRTPSMPA